MISRKSYIYEDISFTNNKEIINEIITKMITQEEKYEDYYIYKDIFTKLYIDISEINNMNDLSQNIVPLKYEISETDYKYLKTTNYKNKNKKIMDIMKNKEIK